MPLFGAHMSIAGGLHNALLAAQSLGMETVQLFTASPQIWSVRPGSDGSSWVSHELPGVDLFRKTLRGSRLKCATAHDSYLINLASPREDLFRRSIEAFVVELHRAEQLGLKYLVTHPGAHLDADEDVGLRQVARALDEVHARCPGFRVQVLLETTAGQGTTLGHRFEHLARILSLVADPGRIGVCLDTCHVFAAGYALNPEAEYRATMKEFDRQIGLKRLRVFHVNDSKKPQGSRVDRHAHLGQGYLGLEPFRFLVNDPRFRNRPMILETPKMENGEEMDPINLGVLRRLQKPT